VLTLEGPAAEVRDDPRVARAFLGLDEPRVMDDVA
jgi:hypothetical protein